MNAFARNWWKRAKNSINDDLGSPRQIAEEYNRDILEDDHKITAQDVKRVMDFIEKNPPKRVENFLFLLEQLTR